MPFQKGDRLKIRHPVDGEVTVIFHEYTQHGCVVEYKRRLITVDCRELYRG